ncbi:MAG: DUF4430 domain-containing protein [Lachnospiraceae bacterium]
MKTGIRNGKHSDRQRVCSAISVLLLIAVFLTVGIHCSKYTLAAAVSEQETLSGQIQQTIDAQIQNSFSDTNDLNAQAGTTGGDWFALAVGRYDASLLPADYLAALEQQVSLRYTRDGSLDPTKATEWHRIAMTARALGADPSAFGTDADGNPINLLADGIYNRGYTRPINAQGINGPIFGILTLCACDAEVPDDAFYSMEDLSQLLLDSQLDDGGFSITGTASDADTTAMALCALSALQKHSSSDSSSVADAIDRALVCLSNLQNERGGFSQYNIENTESAAQVVIALCTLGIDPASDERFTKNGISVFESMQTSRLEDHTYTHIPDERSFDTMATNQALCALIAYERYLSGESAFYELSETGLTTSTPTIPADSSTAPARSETPIRAILCIAVVCAALGCILFCLHKKRVRDLFLIIPLALLIILAILFIRIESVDTFESGAEPTASSTISVTLSIDCETILSNMELLDPALREGGYIPEDGILLPKTTFEIPDNSTVYDLLVAAARKYNMQMEYQGSDQNRYGSVYIQGIGHIYEFSCGSLSGWMYLVNNDAVQQGCNLYTLSEGDEVAFRFTCDLGNDLHVKITETP